MLPLFQGQVGLKKKPVGFVCFSGNAKYYELRVDALLPFLPE
jgi:hypothetical protein